MLSTRVLRTLCIFGSGHDHYYRNRKSDFSARFCTLFLPRAKAQKGVCLLYALARFTASFHMSFIIRPCSFSRAESSGVCMDGSFYALLCSMCCPLRSVPRSPCSARVLYSTPTNHAAPRRPSKQPFPMLHLHRSATRHALATAMPLPPPVIARRRCHPVRLNPRPGIWSR